MLSDPDKRSRYDQFGFVGPHLQGFGGDTSNAVIAAEDSPVSIAFPISSTATMAISTPPPNPITVAMRR